MQVSEAIFKYGRHLGVQVVPIYGGQPIYRQLQQLDRGVDVVVATPGRAVDHIGRGSLPLDDVRIVVLDEADEMLDMGFADDLEAILDGDTRRPPDRAVLGDDAAADQLDRQALPARPDPHPDRQGRHEARARRSIRQRAYVVQRAPQGRRTRPHPRHRVTDRGDRVLPHPWRGRHAHGHDERPRLPRRGAARRHGPACSAIA